MKRVYLLLIIAIILINSIGCSLIAKQPPTLTQFAYPVLIDVPSSLFIWVDDTRDLIETAPETLRILGRNTASCLDVLGSYSNQVSVYNEFYGQ